MSNLYSQTFFESDPYKKVASLEACVNGALHKSYTGGAVIPESPARNGIVLRPLLHPPKKGLSFEEGRARLLHDLASIEMQAMELGLRTLLEFPEAPAFFREELAEVTLSEGHHLTLCLDGLRELNSYYGQWPVHLSLWKAVSPKDSFLDRILIVHRYLEGSGLDAGDTLLRRLTSLLPNPLVPIVKTIVEEEIGHVAFGSRWYREVCKTESIDAEKDFPERMEKLRAQIPNRMEKLSYDLRRKALFTESELQFLETFQRGVLLKQAANHQPKIDPAI